MIDRCDQSIALWAEDGESFVVKNVEKFATAVLPQYFKHSNFSSFARQLNFYGFRKLKAEPILTADYDARTASYVRFYHEYFQSGKPELLVNIKRATKGDVQSKDEVDQLRNELHTSIENTNQFTMDIERKMSEMAHAMNFAIATLQSQVEQLIQQGQHGHRQQQQQQQQQQPHLQQYQSSQQPPQQQQYQQSQSPQPPHQQQSAGTALQNIVAQSVIAQQRRPQQQQPMIQTTAVGSISPQQIQQQQAEQKATQLFLQGEQSIIEYQPQKSHPGNNNNTQSSNSNSNSNSNTTSATNGSSANKKMGHLLAAGESLKSPAFPTTSSSQPQVYVDNLMLPAAVKK
jgi:hypothetical protein